MNMNDLDSLKAVIGVLTVFNEITDKGSDTLMALVPCK